MGHIKEAHYDQRSLKMKKRSVGKVFGLCLCVFFTSLYLAFRVSADILQMKMLERHVLNAYALLQ